MQHVFPDYYENFRCINSRCRHNCCIGWEIDIDDDTAQFYANVTGPLGRRLQENISTEDTTHFVLGEGERCPFLNDDNLCDIIIGLGEEHLCHICAQHPRFHNELPGRIESGLGLTCEEACRIILGKSEPVRLVITGEAEEDDEIVDMRDEVIALLQRRDMSIPQRIEKMMSFFGADVPEFDPAVWADFLLSLERLDEQWTTLLEMLRDSHNRADYEAFDQHMADRQGEYEQLMVYVVYRHMANAPSPDFMPERAYLAAFTCQLLRAIGAVILATSGDFTFEQQTELARLFSSEIEYSDENLDCLLFELAEILGE